MDKLDSKAWLSLGVFVVQNGCSSLIMRYAKTMTGGVSFSSTVVVLVQEMFLKLPFCMAVYCVECGGADAAIANIKADVREKPTEWLKLSIPALLYTVQNTMMYVGYANLEAAIGMVTYQTKILFTAVFSVLLLGKRLSQVQWLSLLVLFLGVLCVQGVLGTLFASPDKSVGRALQEMAEEAADVGRMMAADFLGGQGRQLAAAEPASAPSGAHHHATGSHHASKPSTPSTPHSHSHSHSHTAHHKAPPPAPSPQAAVAVQSPGVGIAAFILAAVCTSFASVYFEKMLKSGASQPSLWLRNVQLASFSSAIALAYVLMQPPPEGFFAGFGAFAWLSAFWQAFGGIIVAVTIKYADNILRGFAQALAIIVGSLGSCLLFGFVITPSFLLGVGLVISAVFMYGAKAQTAHELCSVITSTSQYEMIRASILPTKADDVADDAPAAPAEEHDAAAASKA